MGKLLFITHGAFYLFKIDEDQKKRVRRKRGDKTRMVRSIGLEPTTPTMSRWCSNQLSYERIMVRLIGLEPTTPTMSRWCSNQLSYKRKMVRSIGLEPTTPTMSRWCSNQLSYERIVVVTTGTNISGTRRMWQGENVQFHVTGEVLCTSGLFFCR